MREGESLHLNEIKRDEYVSASKNTVLVSTTRPQPEIYTREKGNYKANVFSELDETKKSLDSVFETEPDVWINCKGEVALLYKPKWVDFNLAGCVLNVSKESFAFAKENELCVCVYK